MQAFLVNLARSDSAENGPVPEEDRPFQATVGEDSSSPPAPAPANSPGRRGQRNRWQRQKARDVPRDCCTLEENPPLRSERSTGPAVLPTPSAPPAEPTMTDPPEADEAGRLGGGTTTAAMPPLSSIPEEVAQTVTTTAAEKTSEERGPAVLVNNYVTTTNNNNGGGSNGILPELGDWGRGVLRRSFDDVESLHTPRGRPPLHSGPLSQRRSGARNSR